MRISTLAFPAIIETDCTVLWGHRFFRFDPRLGSPFTPVQCLGNPLPLIARVRFPPVVANDINTREDTAAAGANERSLGWRCRRVATALGAARGLSGRAEQEGRNPPFPNYKPNVDFN